MSATEHTGRTMTRSEAIKAWWKRFKADPVRFARREKKRIKRFKATYQLIAGNEATWAEPDTYDMSNGKTSNHKTKWLAVIIPILSAAFAVVGFIYYIGQRGSKISEVVEWKKEMAPRIERIDSQGTISFTLFHVQYEKEQAQQYERIKELEREIRQLEVLKQKVESLERAQLDRNPRYQPPSERRP